MSDETARAACLANWPDAENGAYHPSCCRFPKSCSIPTDTTHLVPAPLSGGDARTQIAEVLAEQAWGVLVEADLEGVTDPNLIAHAIVRNQLPFIEARIKAVARQRTVEALELAAVLTVPSEDTVADVRDALLHRAEMLRAEEPA